MVKLTRPRVMLSILTAVLAMMAAAAVGKWLGQSSQGADWIPSGEWALSCTPDWKPGHWSIPVDVFAVTTSARKGLSITDVGIWNRSSKSLAKVKFWWYLYEMNSPDTVIEDGQTGLISVVLDAGAKQTISHFILSFGGVCRPLMNAGRLLGQYHIEVRVCEIHYQDGSVWKWLPAPNGAEPSRLSSPLDGASDDHGRCANARGTFSNGHFYNGISPEPEYSSISDDKVCTVFRCE